MFDFYIKIDNNFYHFPNTCFCNRLKYKFINGWKRYNEEERISSIDKKLYFFLIDYYYSSLSN